ncbi:Uncharacterised protein [Bordetella ansorpii]|uniref:Uncharacterized protein n=2 Tax=Bordetella ansorpii TaxID=288768 RepID=A0A157SH39_9BORD|nr:Uncharacterised protein [Bordetella ansorpii]
MRCGRQAGASQPSFSKSHMSIPKFLLRFTLVYLGLLFGVTIILLLLQLGSMTAVRVVALLTAVMAACQSFAKHNGRYFTHREKIQALIGMTAIDVVLQVAGSLLAFQQAGLEGATVNLGAFLAVIGFLTLVDVAVILFFMWLVGRQVAKEQAKQGAHPLP